MPLEQLLYCKVTLDDVPNDKDIKLSQKTNEIYFNNNKKKIVLKQLDIDNCYSFLNLNIKQSFNKIYNVYINLNFNKFNEIIKNPLNLQNRKNFFNIIEYCSTNNIFCTIYICSDCFCWIIF